MAAIPARRKYGTCFLRIRENCPFRKLRKNKYDVSAAASSGVGVVYWNTPITPASQQQISSVFSQPPLPASTYQNVYIIHQSEAAVAMDTGIAPPPAPPPAAIGGMNGHAASGLAVAMPDGARPQPSNHRQPDHHGDSMDLDGGIDPETGERAQG